MKLYLVLHAQAEPVTTPEKDAARKIVDIGHADVAKVGEFAISIEPKKVAAIYHAHTVRARETAAGFAKHYQSEQGVIEADGLLPDDDIAAWLARANKSEEDFMLVGHMLNLRRVAGELLAGDPAMHLVRFKAGGIACLERDDDGKWGVGWMVTPSMV